MFDLRLGEINFAVLLFLLSFAVVLPVQLLLCFKVRSLFIRLIPVLIFLALAGGFLLRATSDREWYNFAYVLFAIFAGFMLCVCGAGWGIWAVVAVWKKKKRADSFAHFSVRKERHK